MEPEQRSLLSEAVLSSQIAGAQATLLDLLTQFEKYIHADDNIAPLLRAGLLHVQFETIHPYPFGILGRPKKSPV